MQKTSSYVYDSRVKGIKTGSTPEAGYNFVSTATDGKYTYMLVVLGAYGTTDIDGYSYGNSFIDTKNLYDWAFDSFSVAPVMDTTRPIEQIALMFNSEQDTLKLYPQTDFKTLLPNESDGTVVLKEFDIPEIVAAPVKKGDVIGTIKLSISDEYLGKVLLIANEDVERTDHLYYMYHFNNFFSSMYFKVILSILGLFVLFYGSFTFIKYKKYVKSSAVIRKNKKDGYR